MDGPTTCSWHGTDVDAGVVLRQLGSVWKDVTHQGSYEAAVRTSTICPSCRAAQSFQLVLFW